MKYRRTLPSVLVNDSEYIRIKYLRYADDLDYRGLWESCPCPGDKRACEGLPSHAPETSLERGKDSHHPRPHRRGALSGYSPEPRSRRQTKIARITDILGRTYTRRCTGWQTVMHAPLPKIIKRLQERGICRRRRQTYCKKSLIHLDEDQLHSSVQQHQSRPTELLSICR